MKKKILIKIWENIQLCRDYYKRSPLCERILFSGAKHLAMPAHEIFHHTRCRNHEGGETPLG